jgi:hypothetical protein
MHASITCIAARAFPFQLTKQLIVRAVQECNNPCTQKLKAAEICKLRVFLEALPKILKFAEFQNVTEVTELTPTKLDPLVAQTKEAETEPRKRFNKFNCIAHKC